MDVPVEVEVVDEDIWACVLVWLLVCVCVAVLLAEAVLVPR